MKIDKDALDRSEVKSDLDVNAWMRAEIDLNECDVLSQSEPKSISCISVCFQSTEKHLHHFPFAVYIHRESMK